MDVDLIDEVVQVRFHTNIILLTPKHTLHFLVASYSFVTLTQVSSEESIDMARLLAREEGLLVSASHFASSDFSVKPKMS